MALKVSASVRLTISQDNAANPQEVTFDSGAKSFGDTTNYNESVSHTFSIAPSAVDTQIDLGSLASVEMVYMLSKAAGLIVKIVPVGQVFADALPFEILQNAPCLLPFKIKEIYVSNPSVTAATLVLGAAGN